MQKVVTKTNRNYLSFRGLGGFDPPKANIQSVIQQFYEAGIQVKKVITGDNALTTKAIAEKQELKMPIA
jgi:magnesium-transporting ATPase (P-type)